MALHAALLVFSGGTGTVAFPLGVVAIATLISLVSVFVASMGLSSEFHTASNIYRYSDVLREIEYGLNESHGSMLDLARVAISGGAMPAKAPTPSTPPMAAPGE